MLREKGNHVQATMRSRRAWQEHFVVESAEKRLFTSHQPPTQHEPLSPTLGRLTGDLVHGLLDLASRVL